MDHSSKLIDGYQIPIQRPPEIEEILSTLSRFNPETGPVLQDYVGTQCSTETYDIMANLALLKLYQFNPDLMREETVLNILAKSLTVFPEPDFTLCLYLLPPNLLSTYNSTASDSSIVPAAPVVTSDDSLTNSVHRLTYLNSLLEMAAFSTFWSTLASPVDEEYAEIVADVSGFDDAIRAGITRAITLSMRSIKTETALSWLNFKTKEALEKWVAEKMPGWTVEGDAISLKSEAEDALAPSAVSSSSSGKLRFEQLSRVIKRVYENQLIHH
ncbi:eukaryotic translation initiation factor 3 subunit K [Myxozyma melibiosi]|uniref:Eukaryotic translation initiation factor 3 subunit K n=1 Tax=Myxozyma melibiosi TaxID=54550 RepID=A0ABR1F8G8_9ASCO